MLPYRIKPQDIANLFVTFVVVLLALTVAYLTVAKIVDCCGLGGLALLSFSLAAFFYGVVRGGTNDHMD